MLKERIITGAVLSLVVGAVLLLSGNLWVLKIAMALLSIQALRELYRAVKLDHLWGEALSWGMILLLALIDMKNYTIGAAVALLGGMALFGWIISRIGKQDTLGPVAGYLTAGVLVLAFRATTAVRELDQGGYLLTMAILIPVSTDVFAFSVGRRWGKHKMAPRISPKKTMEGSAAGIICAVALLTALTGALNRAGAVDVPMGMFGIYALVSAVLAEMGDLALSAIKRIVGIKDYGALLPGHGGILDRFDSQVFVLPFTYLFWVWLG